MYSIGATDAQVAAALSVTVQTLHNWRKADPSFFDAVKDWKAQADAEVERSLFERARGYSHDEEKIFCQDGQIIRAESRKHYPPDPTSMIFWLKNRQPDKWRDKQEVDHGGEVRWKVSTGVERGEEASKAKPKNQDD